jgi:hypothetical protein
MLDDFNQRVRSDFSRARFKAFMNRLRSALSGQPTIYRGVQVVPIEKIAGSLNRYHQFDRAFMPLEDQMAQRWQNIDRAFYKEVNLPPIVLYKVGDVYFVIDGHHRVSVAREQGQAFIDAEVRECKSKVNITADIKLEDLEILGEKVNFLERTELDHIRPKADLQPTLPGGFDRMLEHIAVHRYFMGLDLLRDIDDSEAVAHWFDTVYLPITRVIRRSGILKEFPGKTEADMYLWVLDRQHFLYQEGHHLVKPHKAAKDFVDEVK